MFKRIPAVLRFFGAMALVGIALHALSACSKNPPATPMTQEQVAIEAKQLEGPDLCKVQLWGAIAFERANGRSGDRAALDRVAWNIAQFKVAEMLYQNPDLSQEQAIAEAVQVVQDVYKTPTLARCENP